MFAEYDTAACFLIFICTAASTFSVIKIVIDSKPTDCTSEYMCVEAVVYLSF